MKNTDLQKLTVEELAKLISPSSEAYLQLQTRNVLRTKNVVGELGEHYAIKFYNGCSDLPDLELSPPGDRIDAKSINGDRYSIKTRSARKGTTGSFWDPESIRKNIRTFDYLIIVILDNSYLLDMILQLTWDDFFEFKKHNKRMNNYNISITKKLLNSVNIIFNSLCSKTQLIHHPLQQDPPSLEEED